MKALARLQFLGTLPVDASSSSDALVAALVFDRQRSSNRRNLRLASCTSLTGPGFETCFRVFAGIRCLLVLAPSMRDAGAARRFSFDSDGDAVALNRRHQFLARRRFND